MKSYDLLQQLVRDNCYHKDQIVDQFDHWYNTEQSHMIWFKGDCYKVTISRENLFVAIIKFCLRIPRKAYKINIELDN
jgi:hypothetical protein